MKRQFLAIVMFSFLATMLLSTGVHAGSSSTVSASVYVLGAPANIVVTNLTTTASVTLGATLPTYITLNNTGGQAATNVIINVAVTGPASYNNIYSAPSLSPQTGENITVQVSGATSQVGNYLMSVFASYSTNSMKAVSNTKTTTFLVTSPGPGPSPSPGGGGGAPISYTVSPPQYNPIKNETTPLVTVSPTSGTLSPSQQITVHVTVHMPSSNKPGIKWDGIMQVLATTNTSNPGGAVVQGGLGKEVIIYSSAPKGFVLSELDYIIIGVVVAVAVVGGVVFAFKGKKGGKKGKPKYKYVTVKKRVRVR